MGVWNTHPARGRCVFFWTPSTNSALDQRLKMLKKKYEMAPESANKFVGASFFPPPLDIKGDVFAEMEARIARVEHTWDRQGDKVPPLCKMGGGEMVRVSEIAQVGPGGAPYRFGGSPRGEGPPRLRTRGVPTRDRHPAGWGNPG